MQKLDLEKGTNGIELVLSTTNCEKIVSEAMYELLASDEQKSVIGQMFYVCRASDNSPKKLSCEMLWKIVNSVKHKKLIAKYRAELAKGRDGDEYKKKLSAYMPQGVYIPRLYSEYQKWYQTEQEILPDEKRQKKLNPRSDLFTLPTGRLVLDFDNVSDPRALYQHFKEVLDAQGFVFEELVVFAWISPSGEGLKIDMHRQKGMTIDEEFSLWEKLVGLPVDHKCKNISRIHFLPQADDILHINEEMLFSNANINPADYPNTKNKSRTMTHNRETIAAATTTCSTPLASIKYEGIPLLELFKTVEQLNGGPAHQGERHNRIFNIACDLRHAVGYDFNVLKQLIPAYDGISCEEHSQAIHGALQYTDAEISNRLLNAVDICQIAKKQRQMQCDIPQMPESLPKCVEDILCNLPENLRASLVLTIFPALTTHFHNVTFHYADNRNYHPRLIVLLVAPPASGKSSVNAITDALMRNITARDFANREREEIWKGECRSVKANQAKPKKPKGLVIQWLSENCTQAALSERLNAADGRCLYIRVDEIELLKKITDGNLEALHSMLRIAYDNSDWGTERKGIDNSSYRQNLALNINASCTAVSLRRFIGRGINDGTLSRLLLPCIVDDPNDWDATIPKYGEYGEDYENRIQPYIDLIEKAEGVITSDDAIQWVEEELQRQMDIAEQNNNRAMKEHIYRSVQSVFRIGMTLYVMNNYQWSQEIEDFLSWAVNFDLWSKMYHLGGMIKTMAVQESTVQHLQNKDLFKYLPDSFTLEQAEKLKTELEISGPSLKEMLRKRVQRGSLEYDKLNRVYTIVKKNR